MDEFQIKIEALKRANELLRLEVENKRLKNDLLEEDVRTRLLGA